VSMTCSDLAVVSRDFLDVHPMHLRQDRKWAIGQSHAVTIWKMWKSPQFIPVLYGLLTGSTPSWRGNLVWSDMAEVCCPSSQTEVNLDTVVNKYSMNLYIYVIVCTHIYIYIYVCV
jgi:hypothetical protein